MSGFEIGGVVLAVFPLVIAGLEQYQKSLETLRLWDARNYQAELHTVRLEIKVQETLFRNSYLKVALVILGPICARQDPSRPRGSSEGEWHNYTSSKKLLGCAMGSI